MAVVASTIDAKAIMDLYNGLNSNGYAWVQDMANLKEWKNTMDEMDCGVSVTVFCFNFFIFNFFVFISYFGFCSFVFDTM